MLDLLLAALAFTVMVALALTALYAVTVVPFLLTLGVAERRGLSTGRWGGFALLGVVLALGLAALARRAGLDVPLQVLPMLLAFAPAAAVPVAPAAVAGRAGRHESAV